MSSLKDSLWVGKYIPTPSGYKQIKSHYKELWWQKILRIIFDIEILKVKLSKR